MHLEETLVCVEGQSESVEELWRLRVVVRGLSCTVHATFQVLESAKSDPLILADTSSSIQHPHPLLHSTVHRHQRERSAGEEEGEEK